jgi:hypothetical protein
MGISGPYEPSTPMRRSQAPGEADQYADPVAAAKGPAMRPPRGPYEPPPELASAVESALRARGARQSGRELRSRCVNPAHEDRSPSFDYNVDKLVGVCRSCGWSGGILAVARLLGFDPTAYRSKGHGAVDFIPVRAGQGWRRRAGSARPR